MTTTDKPVWIEGMPLDPHHFQQWERHFTTLISRAVDLTQPFFWGFADLAVERDGLMNGTFALRRCKGRLPDGFLFDLPASAPLPPPVSLAEKFSSSLGSLPVYLALPHERPEGQNCRLRGQDPGFATRFAAHTITLVDQNTGENRLDIEVAQPGFTLVCGIEIPEGMSVLQVAEVTRSANGQYALNEDFVPPCLAMAASERLRRTSTGVFERILATSDSLLARRRSPGGGRGTDANILLVHAILNSSIPVLRHVLAFGGSHPEIAYLALASLAGQLTAFSTDVDIRPANFVSYDHEKPGQCFDQLRGVILRILDGFLVEDFKRISLDKIADTQWTAKVVDAEGFDHYLAVAGELPEKRFREDFVQKVKIASPEEMQTLIIAALPGLPIVFVEQPPPALPGGHDAHYYRLTKKGRLWDAIVRSGALNVFVPVEFKGVRMDLFALKPL